MTRALSHFAVRLSCSVVMIRAYIPNAEGELKLVYKGGDKKCKNSLVAFPRNGIYTFYLTNLCPNTTYTYRFDCYEEKGRFKTFPSSSIKRCSKNVSFNMMSCFGYEYHGITTNAPENGIYSDKPTDFNLLLGDNIYADYFYETSESKILNVRPAITSQEYDKVYQERFFNVDKINTMLKKSMTVLLQDDHELFDDWNSFYRSFEYDTTPGTNGFSELQIATNIIYTIISIASPSTLAPPPPIPALSQNSEPILWSVMSPDYITATNNGIQAFQDNLNPNIKYFKFSYGKHIEFFVLNIMTDRTPMKINDNTQVLSIISEDQMTWLLTGLSESKAKVKFIVTTETFSDLIILPRLPFSPLSQKLTFDQLYLSAVFNPAFYSPLVSLGGAVPTAVLDYVDLSNVQKFRVFGSAISQLGASGWMYYDNSNTITDIPQTKKQRNQIMDHVKNNNIHGVIFLTGDKHTSFVDYVDDLRTPGSFPLIEICASPSGSEPTDIVTNYMLDNPEQKQIAYATNKKSYLHISTDLDNNTIKIKCHRQNDTTDRIKINLCEYKLLQQGDTTQKPISVNGVPVM